MKRILFFIITVFFFIFASCQNKPSCNCESALFTFDTIPYSYKNYEIYPSISMSDIPLVKVGDSFVALYADYSKYLAPDTMSYLTLTGIRDTLISNRITRYIPTFKEDVKMDSFWDMAFFIKGVKKFVNHF